MSTETLVWQQLFSPFWSRRSRSHISGVFYRAWKMTLLLHTAEGWTPPTYVPFCSIVGEMEKIWPRHLSHFCEQLPLEKQRFIYHFASFGWMERFKEGEIPIHIYRAPTSHLVLPAHKSGQIVGRVHSPGFPPSFSPPRNSVSVICSIPL